MIPSKLIALILAWFALPVLANTGVAFVHGSSKHINALQDYWDSDLIDTVRQGLPDPDNFIVVNCDFDQFPWAEGAAGALADQLTGFIDDHGITDLVVITHSGGSNVVRWILSNPAWDPRFPRIIQAIRDVNALAASSLGTPLANAAIDGNNFEENLGWLLGYQTDMVRFQQTHWMAYYNAHWLYGTSGRPGLPRPFWAVVGTDVETAVYDDDSYCGGYALNLSLEITQEWLDDCSDGFLDCASQAGAGQVWFFDTEFTDDGEPLSHNQSRNDCFGLSQLLRADVTSSAKPVFWQPDITLHPMPLGSLKRPVSPDISGHCDNRAAPVSVSWTLDPYESVSTEPAVQVTSSKSFLVRTSVDRLRLGEGLPLSAAQPLINIHVNDAGDPGIPRIAIPISDITIVDSTGRAHPAGSGLVLGSRQDAVTMHLKPHIGPGRITLMADLERSGAQADRDVLIHVFEKRASAELRLHTSAWTVAPGQELIVHAACVDGNRVWAPELVRGHLVSPSGRVIDIDFASREPGLYRATKVLTQAEDAMSGLWEVRVSCRMNSAHKGIWRDGRAAFTVIEQTAELIIDPRWDVGVDASGNTILRWGLPVLVNKAGRYQLRGLLSSKRDPGSMPIAMSHTAAWLPQGTHTLNLQFSWDPMDYAGITEPFRVDTIRLIDQNRMHIVDRHPGFDLFAD